MTLKRSAQNIASKGDISVPASRYFVVGRHRYGSKYEPPQMLRVVRADKQGLGISEIKHELEVEHGRTFFIDVYPASSLAAHRWYRLSRSRDSTIYRPELDFVLLASRAPGRAPSGMSNVTVCTEIEVFYHSVKAELCAAQATFERAWQNTIIVPFRSFKQVLMSTAHQLFSEARHVVDVIERQVRAAARPAATAGAGKPTTEPESPHISRLARAQRTPAP